MCTCAYVCIPTDMDIQASLTKRFPTVQNLIVFQSLWNQGFALKNEEEDGGISGGGGGGG